MKQTVVFLLGLFISSFVFTLQAQSVHDFLEKVNKFNENHPQEKLYLQLDKYAYSAGENIWFKAYATIGIENFFSNLSGLAYVELIDPTERKIDSLIIPLGMGVGLGNFAIADTITEGSYRLRAYTNWMRNTEDGYFYDRTIHIANGRSDNIFSTTTYQAAEKNNIYTILLKKASGLPLANAKIRYEVIYQGKSVERKRAKTDDSGNLVIEVAKKYPYAQLSLRIENEEENIVNKFVKVINPEAEGSIQLLPEGGKLLEGFINTIGIKSINQNGLGQHVKLTFTSGKDTLGYAETNELGMTAFNLYLNPGDSLAVFATYDSGNIVPVKVPEIYKSGYGIQVNNQNPNKVFAQLNTSEDRIDNQDVYLLVHHLGRVLFVSKQKINKPELSFIVSKEQLPNGVITLSVLNAKFEPIIERPIFNYNQENLLALALKTDKNRYGAREKVKVDLAILNNDSLKISALSASVLNSSKIIDNPYVAPNILSSLLLSADVKGYIEKPGFYFEKNILKTIDMDYLMMTQGWRNLDWRALDLNLVPRYAVEKSMSVSGYTKKLGRSKPESNASVQLISTHNFMDFIDTTSNEEGYFAFDNLLFPDSIKFILSAKNEKGKRNIDIVYNKPIALESGINRNWADEKWDVNSLYQEELKNTNLYFSALESAGLKAKSKMIEEVVVRAQKTNTASKNSSNLNGSGRADQIITAEDLASCTTLEMCLSGRLVGVYWQMGVPYNTRGNQPMSVVLDGMFIEADQISMINVPDVESIEVLRNSNYTSIYGMNGADGVIVITSKRGDSALRSYTPTGIITIQPQGFHVPKTFYKPVYDVSNSTKITQDLRTTIHWEPLIVTNQQGKASFDFYTADEKGKYIIVIEGLDINGKICREIKEIEIQ